MSTDRESDALTITSPHRLRIVSIKQNCSDEQVVCKIGRLLMSVITGLCNDHDRAVMLMQLCEEIQMKAQHPHWQVRDSSIEQMCGIMIGEIQLCFDDVLCMIHLIQLAFILTCDDFTTAPINSRLNVVVRSPTPFGLGRNGCLPSRKSQLPRALPLWLLSKHSKGI